MRVNQLLTCCMSERLLSLHTPACANLMGWKILCVCRVTCASSVCAEYEKLRLDETFAARNERIEKETQIRTNF